MNTPVMNSAHLRAVARLTFGNTASRIYLGVVAATAVFVAVDTLFVAHEDASFAGVWLFFLAAPTVFAFLAGGSVWGADAPGPDWFVYLALVVSVLVQSFALGWFVRLLRGGAGRTRSAHPQGT
ncbi:SCO4225 family membrane protein [Streptomyces sp. NPDC058221]|uniref:SCO4225 family membrane protein n=1 Tax=Streptomyces sp. NPDC058221 TaxID=3346388 RepID=UPI0036EF5B9E